MQILHLKFSMSPFGMFLIDRALITSVSTCDVWALFTMCFLLFFFQIVSLIANYMFIILQFAANEKKLANSKKATWIRLLRLTKFFGVLDYVRTKENRFSSVWRWKRDKRRIATCVIFLECFLIVFRLSRCW